MREQTEMFERSFLEDNMMGPCCVTIAEELLEGLNLTPGLRVLDLGCGRGLSSIFLARRFGVRVVAADLWIDPTDNYERFRAFGLEDAILPLRAEAHALLFARGFFDAVISVDSYHYFGAEAGYVDEHIAPLLKPGGLLAVAVPGLQREMEHGVPEELKPWWVEDMNFHSAAWWRALWECSPSLKVERSFSLRCHRRAWEEWLRCDEPHAVGDRAMMEAEGGRWFDTVGIIATARERG